ncbi:hypothetical protein VPH35_111402 [Triticum aestivum]
MLTTSEMNSFIPCLDSCDTFFTAISAPDVGSTPLYTLPNPPMPSSRSSENPLVAWNKSLYEKRCGPNSVSHSSFTSAYLRRLRSIRTTAMASANTNAADAIGNTIYSVFDRRLGVVNGRAGSFCMFSGGACPPSILKLQAST